MHACMCTVVCEHSAEFGFKVALLVKARLSLALCRAVWAPSTRCCGKICGRAGAAMLLRQAARSVSLVGAAGGRACRARYGVVCQVQHHFVGWCAGNALCPAPRCPGQDALHLYDAV